MKNNTPKEPIPPRNRDRPLQQSMFVDHYQPPNLNTSTEQIMYNPMKRSLMENAAQGGNQYQFKTQPQPTQNQPNTSFTTGYQNPPFSLVHHSSSASNIKPYNLMRSQTLEESKPFRFEKPENRPPLKPKSSELLPSQKESLITEIINQIKDKHLPPIINLLKKEFYEEITHLKQQFLNMREEMTSYKVKQDSLGKELKGRQKRSLEDADLQKDFFLLDGRVKELQSRLGKDLEQIKSRLQEGEKGFFKVGILRSSLSPIMLEYKESLKIKGRSSSQQKITLSTCQYFIDKGGFLMDHQNRYLIDRRGNQIRLEQKHLRLLEKHKILYK